MWFNEAMSVFATYHMVWKEDKQCGPESSQSKVLLKLDSMFYDILMLWSSRLSYSLPKIYYGRKTTFQNLLSIL